MKRFTLLLMALTLLFLSSCASEPNPGEALRFPIELQAKSEGSEAVFTAIMDENQCKITFKGASALEDTELVISDSGNSARVNGFARELKKGIFPPQEALYRAIKLLQKSETSGVETQNGIKYTIDETAILVYYDKSTGLLTGIETEESGRRYKFTLLSLNPYEAQSDSAG